jgi:ferredoxin
VSATAWVDPPSVIAREGLDAMIAELRRLGFTTIGPTVRDGAVRLLEIASTADLPEGIGDEQDGGRYRLRRRGDRALFGYNLGQDSWKRFLLPPSVRLWSAARTADGVEIVPEEPRVPAYAFLGVRACELRAIAVLTRVMTGGAHVDPDFAARREPAFVVAVNCGQAAGTCFCASMGTGPRAGPGFDLAVTEILEGEHRFLAEAGTERGARVLRALPRRPAQADDARAADRAVQHAEATMGRRMETAGIRDLLVGNPEHPRWDDVAERCLTCGNCTAACPTCFCTTTVDTTDLAGTRAERHRAWDSCFTLDFTHLAGGGSVRSSGRSRYRHWITHKLATWHDQFGESGCVGCGRCIAWCPVGIDITEEVAAIRADSGEAP